MSLQFQSWCPLLRATQNKVSIFDQLFRLTVKEKNHKQNHQSVVQHNFSLPMPTHCQQQDHCLFLVKKGLCSTGHPAGPPKRECSGEREEKTFQWGSAESRDTFYNHTKLPCSITASLHPLLQASEVREKQQLRCRLTKCQAGKCKLGLTWITLAHNALNLAGL